MNDPEWYHRSLYRVYQMAEPERVGERYRCRVGGCRLDLSPTEVIQLFPQLVRILELDREQQAAKLAEITDELDYTNSVIADLEAEQLEGGN